MNMQVGPMYKKVIITASGQDLNSEFLTIRVEFGNGKPCAIWEQKGGSMPWDAFWGKGRLSKQVAEMIGIDK